MLVKIQNLLVITSLQISNLRVIGVISRKLFGVPFLLRPCSIDGGYFRINKIMVVCYLCSLDIDNNCVIIISKYIRYI